MLVSENDYKLKHKYIKVIYIKMDTLYQSAVLSRELNIPMTQIGGNVSQLMESILRRNEGKCCEEGYIKRGSIKILHHSCGVIKGIQVFIEVVFECKITNPLIGQLLSCVVESNTKAGIRSRLDAPESPFIVFLARDHHYQYENFSQLKEGDKIKVKMIGKRYEINDDKISIMAVMDDTYVEPPPLVAPKEEAPPEVEEEEEDVLVFFIKSKDVYPGKGIHEHLVHPKEYDALSKITKWRSQLSPLDVAPFTWTGEGLLPIPFAEGTQWNSIEHAYHGSKFKFYKFDDAERFTLNSGDIIGKGDGSFAQKHRTLHAIKDMKAWNDLSESIKKDISLAKFSQHKEKMKILKLTREAHLIHMSTQRGASTQERLEYLEEIRDSVKD